MTSAKPNGNEPRRATTHREHGTVMTMRVVTMVLGAICTLMLGFITAKMVDVDDNSKRIAVVETKIIEMKEAETSHVKIMDDFIMETREANRSLRDAVMRHLTEKGIHQLPSEKAAMTEKQIADYFNKHVPPKHIEAKLDAHSKAIDEAREERHAIEQQVTDLMKTNTEIFKILTRIETRLENGNGAKR
jgi:adenylosuccinate synthase